MDNELKVEEIKNGRATGRDDKFWELFEKIQELQDKLFEEREKRLQVLEDEMKLRQEMLLLLMDAVRTMETADYESTFEKNRALAVVNKIRPLLKQYEFDED